MNIHLSLIDVNNLFCFSKKITYEVLFLNIYKSNLKKKIHF